MGHRSVVLLALSSAACTGSIADEQMGGAVPDAPGGEQVQNPFGGTDPGALPDGIPSTTRVARLTHRQYDNTVSDLLFLAVSASSEFEADPVFNGYDNSIQDLAVAGRLGRDYRRAAEALAERAVNDATAYARLVPCDPSAEGCAAEFVSKFGLRAYRRPLSPDEQLLYEATHARGAELIGSSDAFKDGVQLVIEAALQSPKFLYRNELTRAQQADGFLKLGGYEVAQRLSYMLWNTMPDDALFEAAASGRLDDGVGVATEAMRLLTDPRAREPVSDFHHQWLQMDHYLDLTRDPELFPAFSSALGRPMQEESKAFINHVVFELEEGFETLFSAPFSFVNSDLAALYGLDGDFGSELQKVDLDPALRRGLLTQLGFLSSHAYPSDTSPIHRGVYIYRRILCKTVPEPVGIDTSQGKVEKPRTTREAVELQTSQAGCVNCHQLFNPLGFAFEQFDAVGQLRTSDRGNPVDTTGETTSIDGQLVNFQSSTDLIGAIATSSDARTCYAQNWLRYAYGRENTPSDLNDIEAIASAMASSAYSVKNMLSDLTQTKAFRYRAPNLD